MTGDCSLVLRTPSDLLAALPFLLGYHPRDDLALVGLRGRELDFGACLDLPPPDRCAETAREVAGAVARQRPDAMVIVGYGPPRRVTPVVLSVAEALRAAGVRIDDVLRVDDGRWWSYLCEDPGCCPPQGLPCPPPDSVIAASATYLGRVALPSREHLVAQVAAVRGPARRAMAAATERARSRFPELLDDVRRIRRAGRLAIREAEKRYRSGAALTDDEVAWLGSLLVDRGVEDYALDRTGPEEWRVRLWTDVVRRVEKAFVAAPACLLGFAAWRLGRGALARVAVDRALSAEPGHQLARMLFEVLICGVPPALVNRRAG
ncbi:hypothetical protein GCM10010112_74490 [Actinoplanes lobatus]|uniref:DUF4192 domain-containing protein n=1 Tax=Actinoplanes lobatus TaxID=113568 RepID=A0A7W7HC68_9ACTN|nr:DUF4192 domain-containing protein [Actinoplanes lobatus]MBB4747845.1 hypothetical protein [Actinoplanes lobatus]GGN89731.1 hypothetical protein GCM10010112_74490 [Actinoplanes lobatus]GIE43724.1 hypothetical protein Alo02nite_66220 [Actinoplanes lobatus]